MGRVCLTVLAYRVFPYLQTAPVGQPGHPLYEHTPQAGGRVDHPDYFVWYFARQPEGAIGESFGNLSVWDESMFGFPLISGARRALGVYRLPDDLRVLDLDDPTHLVEFGLRPTQVVTRNLAVTQAWGHRMWEERDPHDRAKHRWEAVQWWSYHRPVWDIIASWVRPELDHIENLTLGHFAITEAARALQRATT